MASADSLDPKVLAYLQGLLQKLAPGENPYVLARAVLREELYPDLPTSTFIQLYILSGIYAVALICVFVTLFLRWRRRATFALFRFIPTSRGPFICPQTSNTFTLLTGTFLAVLQGYIWVTIRVNRDHGSQINFVLWKSIIWIPLYLTLVSETWGVLITTFMSARHKRSPESSWIAPIPPIVVNAFFITLSIGSTIAIIIVFVFANLTYNEGFREYLKLDNLMVEAAPTYTGNLDLEQFLPYIPFLSDFLQKVKTFIHLFRAGYYIWVVVVGGTLLIYLPIALVYIKTLRSQIKLMKARFNAPVSSFFSYGDPVLADRSRPQMSKEEMRQHYSLTIAYANLSWTCAAVISCGGLYTFLVVWICADTTGVLHKPVPYQIETLGSLYIYAAFGLIANVLTMLRAIDSTANHKLSSRSGPSVEAQSSRKKSGVSVSMRRFSVSRQVRSTLPTSYPSRMDAMANFEGDDEVDIHVAYPDDTFHAAKSKEAEAHAGSFDTIYPPPRSPPVQEAVIDMPYQPPRSSPRSPRLPPSRWNSPKVDDFAS
ncbi:hypothetical protein BT69DRAFT_1352705 [Atractiella rhizophila]|nr:hypothetical protein BT69DRAFT_1352705 [Atractiella rhizophila]